MTLASDIIKRAYRESNLIPLAATPNSNQETEALALLNSLLLGTVGNGAGEELCELNIGGTYDQSSFCSEFVPANVRLALNLGSAKTLRLHPQPYDGQRIALVDASGNLATYNLTLDGYGRKIEDAATLTLSTNSIDRQWMYRADKGNWVRVTSLATSDEMPFPVEFDDYFQTRLALRLNPRYGQALSQEVFRALSDSESRLAARYRRPRPKQDIGSLGLMGQNSGAYSTSTSAFNAGRPGW